MPSLPVSGLNLRPSRKHALTRHSGLERSLNIHRNSSFSTGYGVSVFAYPSTTLATQRRQGTRSAVTSAWHPTHHGSRLLRLQSPVSAAAAIYRASQSKSAVPHNPPSPRRQVDWTVPWPNPGVRQHINVSLLSREALPDQTPQGRRQQAVCLWNHKVLPSSSVDHGTLALFQLMELLFKLINQYLHSKSNFGILGNALKIRVLITSFMKSHNFNTILNSILQNLKSSRFFRRNAIISST